MSASDSKYWAVVPAAGIGRRMGTEIPKQYLELAGKPVIEHTIERLAHHPMICGVVVALAADDPWWGQLTLELSVPLERVTGGAERCHSVLNALSLLKARGANDDWVLVHDAARPCLRLEDLDRLIDNVDDEDGGLLAMPVRDTMKEADGDGRVAATRDREGLWHALTPQLFRVGSLHDALADAVVANELVTDEAAAMERAGRHPRLVEGHGDNIKITRPEDLALAEFFLRYQADELRARTISGLDDGG
ncbi:MAG TPA: 2-C-methyl-D-erythritol 4-phosphate cytidylyltransferase [Gammaproteobacteria bacterium]|nr:2-C-methyl-D-erythritol 4-phosphate cytidylyltransferase [Gammaproteobacteria bacterium]